PFADRVAVEREPCAGKREPLQLLMPMAGKGSRFGDGPPKFLRLIAGLGKPMFEAAIEHLPACESQVVVVQDAHADSVQSVTPEARVVRVSGSTEGQAVTCALACASLDPDRPVLVSSCDHGMVWDEARWQALLDQDPDVIVWGQRGYPGADATPE